MPIYIFDVDAFDKMALAEGSTWRAEQERYSDPESSSYGIGSGCLFSDFRKAWDVSRGSFNEKYWKEVYEPCQLEVIYGREGYARYAVRDDGEIVLLAWSVREERRDQIRKLGFTVV